jgi:hypothetical protein
MQDLHELLSCEGEIPSTKLNMALSRLEGDAIHRTRTRDARICERREAVDKIMERSPWRSIMGVTK